MNDLPEMRVSDAERDLIAQRLNQAVGEGRITLTEYNERVGLAYAALTRGELDRVVADLPVLAAPAPTPVPIRHSPVGEKTKWVVSFMSGAVRKGRWRVTRKTAAIAVMGGTEIDLRRAEFSAPEITVVAVAFMGGVEITVPPGVRVEVGGFSFMGGKEVKVDDEDLPPNAPVVHVKGFAFMGGIDIRTKPARKAISRGDDD
ncbi:MULTISPECIES: DUF1707 SHOCT-like domain-containing protein [unclassified Crossiella]|uniref:DUF1707 SHOCT-like domain-containing protein n=1 Tax=unclassified Crossiella TaxID=2620835 RepID=UPI001FFF5D82|nr:MULTISPECIES: DUF1707 domain-containing protein [unclassified Crossiella]MCK2240815.1 DUF1707 domain-containing protein [Crossiella sp. S99.2]MCK2254041.1 DUF1707 domain-containing protein [Crossiella sp. S99.1]